MATKKKVKIELYAEAPYMQGYTSGIANEKFYNPYAEIEDAEADAEAEAEAEAETGDSPMDL